MAAVLTNYFNDKHIIIMDFTKVGDYHVLETLVNESIKLVRPEKEKSVLAVLDLSNTPINRKVISLMKKLSQNNGPYIKLIAFAGLNIFWTFIFKIILSGKPNHRVINKRNDAIEWLIKG